MSIEYLQVNDCPKCEGVHKYSLKVERSVIMKMMTSSDLSEKPRKVKLIRLFTCPTSQEDYQATFILTDTSSDRIEGVTVLGATDNDKQ